MFALQNASGFTPANVCDNSKIDISYIGSQMIEGYPVVDMRQQQPVSYTRTSWR